MQKCILKMLVSESVTMTKHIIHIHDLVTSSSLQTSKINFLTIENAT